MYSLISFEPYALSPKILQPFISICERTSTASVLSCKLPDDNLKWTGLPMPSTTAWIFVVFPPWLSPICWFVSLFLAPF